MCQSAKECNHRPPDILYTRLWMCCLNGQEYDSPWRVGESTSEPEVQQSSSGNLCVTRVDDLSADPNLSLASCDNKRPLKQDPETRTKASSTSLVYEGICI